jgi:heat shock protein HslJ
LDAQQPNRPPEVPAQLVGIEWRLAHHRGPDGDLVAVPADVLATAVLVNGRVAGTTGCNRYHATYIADGPALSVGPLATTMMACEPARDAVERAFITALGDIAAYAIHGEVLDLAQADGRVLLRFRAAPAQRLSGTRWVATAINNGRGGVVSALEGAEVFAVFGDDGRVSGSGGCNQFTGPYTVEGDALAIGPLAATLRACLAPEGVGEQEAACFAALGRVATWSVREGRLRLRAADGALEVELRAPDAG